jgi:hypothetical protein
MWNCSLLSNCSHQSTIVAADAFINISVVEPQPLWPSGRGLDRGSQSSRDVGYLPLEATDDFSWSSYELRNEAPGPFQGPFSILPLSEQECETQRLLELRFWSIAFTSECLGDVDVTAGAWFQSQLWECLRIWSLSWGTRSSNHHWFLFIVTSSCIWLLLLYL